MNKNLLLIFLFLLSLNSFSQRGIKIGYIDTEYILENLSEFNSISERLEEKSEEWIEEIEQKSKKIENKKENLKSEKIFLTKEMIEEVEEEIEFEENELNDYKQKKFGPNGDYILQKKQLVQPIQDQIFNAIKDIAKNKNYDFIFDKSADIVMLYSNRRHDISDQVIRIISRSNNRKKLDSRKDKREVEEEDLIEDSVRVTDTIQDENKLMENDSLIEESFPKKRLSVKELLEQRKQKNSNKRKVKD